MPKLPFIPRIRYVNPNDNLYWNKKIVDKTNLTLYPLKNKDYELNTTSVKLIQNLLTNEDKININDINLRDSTSKVYYKQIETIVGKPMDVIQSDLEKLKEMPDSLLVLQSMALDTLRAIQEKQLLKPKGISIGLN